MSVYFVGGASAAGKTTCTKSLALRFHLPVVELDDFQRLIMDAIPSLERRAPATFRIAEAVLRELLSARSHCIVEGSWLEPREADQLRREFGPSFQPVYCGYHDPDLTARSERLKSGGRHWLSQVTPEHRTAFLATQRAHSEVFRRNCEHLGLPYFDFTSFEDGAGQLEQDFRSWLAPIASSRSQ